MRSASSAGRLGGRLLPLSLGRLPLAQDSTPYGIAPEALFADPVVPALFQGILDQINSPELPTIYGPVTRFAFLLGYGVTPGSVAAPQAIFIIFDLLTIGLLLRLASRRAVLPWW